jgi:hypothetical protein
MRSYERKNNAFYEFAATYSPAEEVPVISFSIYIRVAKYTLCDI